MTSKKRKIFMIIDTLLISVLSLVIINETNKLRYIFIIIFSAAIFIGHPIVIENYFKSKLPLLIDASLFVITIIIGPIIGITFHSYAVVFIILYYVIIIRHVRNKDS